MAQPPLCGIFAGKERPGPFLQLIAHEAEAPIHIGLIAGRGEEGILTPQPSGELAEDIALAQAEGREDDGVRARTAQ